MKNEFVSYKQALALKKLGFDELCIAGYDREFIDKLYIGFSSDEGILFNSDFYTYAPLKQQVFRWFSEKYGFDFYITRMLPNTTNRDVYHIVLNDLWAPNDSYKNYEDAESRLVDNLIELAKQQDK